MADQVLQDIKDRLDIVELIGSYIPVKRSGTNFKAVCPFHNEKTASLMISPQKQIWHCFGCGEGGDAFGFVIRYENIDFREALRLLADRAGIQLPNIKYDPAKKDEAHHLVRINTFVAKLYHQILLSSPVSAQARDYLKERGLTEATIAQWEIGYAPETFDTVIKELSKKNVSEADLVKAGVAVGGNNGRVWDRFRNRITFPIYNYYGEIVGFSARALKAEDEPKYLNSSETPIYNKSKILFGLNFAKEAIRKSDEVVVVEGQMDCLSCHQAGFKNTVATSGTALTSDQLRLLMRLTKNLKLCFDQDSAGHTAARRAGVLALQLGFRVKVVVLAGAKDPDEALRNGTGVWQHALKDAVWFVDYYIEHAKTNYAPNSLEQKQYLGTEVLPLVTLLQDPLEKDHYVRMLSEQFGITESVIRRSAQSTASEPTISSTTERHSSQDLLEKQILGGAIIYPDFRQLLMEEAESKDFTPLTHEFIISLLKDKAFTPQQLDTTLAREAQFMVESQLEQLAGNEPALIRELNKSFYLLKLNSIRQQQRDITAQIQQAEQQQAKPDLEELNQKFMRLSTLRVSYESKV